MSAPTKLKIWYFLTLSVQITIRVQFSCIFHSEVSPQPLYGIHDKTKHEMGFPYGVTNTSPFSFREGRDFIIYCQQIQMNQNLPTSDPGAIATASSDRSVIS